MEEYRDRDESLIERQKLVEDGGDEEGKDFFGY